MPESVMQGFKRLFEIRLLHHYWLDDGATMFDLMISQSKKRERLIQYDVRNFLELKPTDTTAARLKGLGCIFKATSLGGVVAAKADAVIPLDASFSFVLLVRSPDFFNYTALTLQKRRIFEIYHAAEDRMYRFKENVPVLSNLTGAARGAGANKVLYLSREIPAAATNGKVESFLLVAGSLAQLTGNQPGAAIQQVGAVATNLPVFLHQEDAQPIVPPAGLTGAPARGIELTSDLPDEVFSVITISPIRADDGDFSIVDPQGKPLAKGPVFEVRFKNRSTFWRYFNRSTGVLDSTEPAPLPLTYFSNAGTRQKPSNGLVKADLTGTSITRLVSEIFI